MFLEEEDSSGTSRALFAAVEVVGAVGLGGLVARFWVGSLGTLFEESRGGVKEK